MERRELFTSVAEVFVIVLISALMGVAWNRSLLLTAWHAEATPLVQEVSKGEELPMPIGLAQVKEMHDAKEAVIVDARSAVSFAEGHIRGAISLPVEEARKPGGALLKGRVPATATIIAYCNGFSCHDSMDLGKILMHAGYAAVYVYEGGFPEWRDAGYPTSKGAP